MAVRLRSLLLAAILAAAGGAPAFAAPGDAAVGQAAASPGADAEPALPAGPYLLVDAEDGRVIEDRDALRPWYPASTSKLMTIYVAFRAIRAGQVTLGSPIFYGANAAKQPPSKMAFPVGATLALDDALKIIMVKSANDVAVAVAETIGGSVPGFAQRMNAESRRIGMTRSHWVNPNGLHDPGQVTTARDMALLARTIFSEFPQYRSYFSIPAIQFGTSVIKNYNPLLERYPGASGMKTGFICPSGYNLVASARRDGREIIAVVFGEYGGNARAEHAARLLDDGFAAARTNPAVTLGSVRSGEAYTAPLDMRPYVCSRQRAAAASEANTDDAGGADPAARATSHLGPPVAFGPPTVVTITPPPVEAKWGEPGFVARLPRPRPDRATDSALPEAFAPVAQALDAAAPSVRAIGELLQNPTAVMP